MSKVYTTEEIALVKGLLATAPRVNQLRPGTIPRIAKATGVNRNTILAIIRDDQWKAVAPAPAEVVAHVVDWDADPNGWDALPPQGQPLEPAADA